MRAGQLQQFLKQLQQVGRAHLGLANEVELLVINRQDWHKLFSYPYGWPFTRTQRGRKQGVSLIAPATYPERMIRRWDDIFVRAARTGVKTPGEVREFLDLLIGHEWGHAAANLSGVRMRVKWFDELMATYLFLAALNALEMPAVYARFLAWAELEVAGSKVERADLGAFEYPRAKLRFDNLLWFQGVFTLRAAELLEERGWAFPTEMREVLARRGRGDVARALIEVEPSFKAWFSVFGETADAVSALSTGD